MSEENKKEIENSTDEYEEYYIVDFGSSYINKSDYWKIENGEYKGGWDQWIKDNPPELDQVLTEDGDYPEEEQE